MAFLKTCLHTAKERLLSLCRGVFEWNGCKFKYNLKFQNFKFKFATPVSFKYAMAIYDVRADLFTDEISLV